jgi:sorting nexin-8
VDVLFDEDKTFWAGVQSLIATSKRPIVLTCNSLEDVDLSELSLHAVLHYSHPEIGKAVEQLGHIAAAEGHVIDGLALRTLYMSRGQDLRAAIADLNFWCQMTVGSSMGGLDWMRGGSGRPETDKNDYRIVSKDTFYDGLHLVPEQQLSPADILAFAQHSLGLNVMEWEAARSLPLDSSNASKTRLSVLEEADMVAAFQSCMDIADPDLQPTMSCLLSEASPARKANITRAELAQFLLSQNTHLMVGRAAVYEALIPLTEDLRTFPPPAGRTAPSLDNKGLSIATEVAPYVRQIVWLDQQMEKQRAEIDASSQGTGRQRKTRAARAALEGGDVANTRVDRWFPKDLEFSVVLETGGRWHNELEWVEFEAPSTLSRESTDVTMVEMD